MPAWLLQILIQTVIPSLLSMAYRSGMVNLVEENVILFWTQLRSFHEPEDFPSPPTGQTNNHNFTVGNNP